MVKLKTAYYITTDDVNELLGKEKWFDCEFAENLNGGSEYAIIHCDDGTLQDWYDEIDDLARDGHANYAYYHRACNQIKLIEAIRRELGVYSEILVYVDF